MKFTDLLIFLLILSISYSFIKEEIGLYSKINVENQEYLEKKNGLKFISDSFINTCNGKGFDSLYEWQKVCKDMWKLDYIGWCNGEEFLSKEITDKNLILYGTWYGAGLNGEIYWKESLNDK